MNYQALFAAAGDRRVRMALVGLGDFGASLIAQTRHIANLEVRLICDRDGERLARFAAMCPDATAVTGLDDADLSASDILVEATGQPATAAENALKAIATGLHVAMVTKEADILVGPVLHRLAAEKSLVYTPVVGDQPGLLIGLLAWADTLGLDVIAAGKASEYDFVLHAGDLLHWRDRQCAAPGLNALWDKNDLSWADLAAARSEIATAAGVPTQTAPDYCEMGIVVNATKLAPNRPALLAPVLRTSELADALQPAGDGGLLQDAGRIEVFNCLRRPDEASFAGGVFIIVACQDRATWAMLREKGHMVAANGRAAMLYNPQHLLGIEAPISILAAVLLGLPTGGLEPRPTVDMIARTSRDFRAGEKLAITDFHHHEVDGLAPELHPARALAADAPCPYYLAVAQQFVTDVPAGKIVTCAMLALPDDSALIELRRRQDRLFELA